MIFLVHLISEAYLLDQVVFILNAQTSIVT